MPGAAPGAVALVAHRGRVVTRVASGYGVLFDADGELLPAAQRSAISDDQLFDIASLTKLLTATAALVQVEAGRLDLDAAVCSYLPEFGDGSRQDPLLGARRRVTVRQLLTHTSGLPPALPLWRIPGGRTERVQRLLTEPLVHEPGAVHVYSCVGFMVLGLILERVTATLLPALLTATVFTPLGMTCTGHDVARGQPDAAAATEYQRHPPRGLLRGSVHDEAAWALTGAGNAGVFSTVGDLLTFAEMVRRGVGGGRRLLSGRFRALLGANALDPRETARVGYGQALGFRVGDSTFMGSSDPALIGHTGFTGTSLVIDRAHDLTVVLLTNRVHPIRSAFDIGPLRRAVVSAARRWAAGACAPRSAGSVGSRGRP